jgi:pimeloyl-ACP methyl ester carboxylesterase
MIGNYGHLDKTWIKVIARSALAGQTVELHHRGERIARAALAADGDFATAEFSLPMPPRGKPQGPITARVGSQTQALLQLPNADDLRRQTFEQTGVVFEPFVFTGTTLPPCHCEDPELIRRIMGDYSIRVRYFDAGGAEVHSADKEGRYGAVVELTAGDQTVKHYYTLMRWSDQWAAWAKESATWTEFLKRVGLDTEAVKKQDPRTRMAHYEGTDSPTRQMLARPAAALVLAAVFEKAGSSRDASSRDRSWWYGIKRSLGDAKNDYQLTLPPHYDASRREPWPLIVFLHGSGGGEGALANFVKNRADFPFIILAPRSPHESWIPEAVKDDLDEVLAKYPVDRDRIYLTGLSMGGFGTWEVVARYPDLFAAIAPVCGGGHPADAPLIRHVPVWIFHGVKDETVPVALSQAMFDALKKVPADEVKFTAYPEAGHDSWTPTYNNDQLDQWFLQHRRHAAAGAGPSTL